MADGCAPAFELEGVAVRVADATLLSHISLALPAGRWTALLGPSGSGKSTLLRVLNRLIEPSAGTVRLAGTPLAQLDVRALRRRVGLVVQQPRLSAGSVRANLELPLRLGAITRAESEARLPEALERAQLMESMLEREVSGLSGGERQRVALARALMLQPQVLLLDEPTSALDPDTARRVLQAIEALRRERGVTPIVITHRLDEVDRLDADSGCVVLAGGRVVETGRAREVFERPASAAARVLLGRQLEEEGGDEGTD